MYWKAYRVLSLSLQKTKKVGKSLETNKEDAKMNIRLLAFITMGAFVFAFAQTANADCGQCGSDEKHKGKHKEKAEHKHADHEAAECEDRECEAHPHKGKHKGSKKDKESAHADNKAEISGSVLSIRCK